jgi:4-amino-4-deoxy-L-arabinose transferase-like glycosyltransferase
MSGERSDRNSPGGTATRSALILIIAAAAALRFWGLRFGLPQPFARPDEEVIADVALGVLRDPNPHFFDWPTLFMYLTAAAYAVLFAFERALGGAIRHATIAKAEFEPVLHLIPRAISATSGVLTVAALYGAARELFSQRVALLSAGCLALTYLHVRDSHFGVTDVPVTFLTVCALWAGLRCATKGLTNSRVAMAGLLCGLATTTKYNGALIVLPAVMAIIAQTVVRQPRAVGPAIRALGLLGLCATVAFLAGTPFAALDWRTFLPAVIGVRHHLARGHVVLTKGWTYHVVFTFWYGVGPLLMAAALAGACWMIAQEPWPAALVLVFPVSYYAVVGSGLTVFVRYMMPMVPFICLTAAYCVDRVGSTVGDWTRDTRRPPAIASYALAAVIIAPTAAASVSFDRLMSHVDTRVLGADWVESQFPTGTSIYQTGIGFGYLIPTPRRRYTQYLLNERTGGFEVHGRPAVDLPDLIVLLESPLAAYSQIPSQIHALVAKDYRLAATFEGAPAAGIAGTAYDLDDAFYAPFGGTDRVARPGPQVSIFVRR